MVSGAKITVQGLSVGQLKSEKLRRLMEFWEGLRAARPLPLRADFTPEQLDFLLGQLTLVDVTHDPLTFRFRLVGTRIEEAGRRGDQNKTLSEIKPDTYRDALGAAYNTAMSSARPVINSITVHGTHGVFWYEQIVLPLSLEGERVDMLIDAVDWPPEMEDGYVSS